MLGTAQLVLYGCYWKRSKAAVVDAERGRHVASSGATPELHKNSSDVQLLARTVSIEDRGSMKGEEANHRKDTQGMQS
jgi:hypothetical protein